MPAPGDQHRDNANTLNPFIPQIPHISEYTAQQIATLQSRLEKQLGPEYISTRPGNGGGKVHYLAAEKVINLANEVFGFNGWSSQIQNVQIDFVDENPQTQRINLGLSTIVRVTLKDGTFHEDIGYGHCENTKGKAAAFEKAKKEAATDAMKRALRNFGNVLGNCLYDKDYLSKVSKVKVAPSKWDAENLHRHPDFAPIKQEPTIQANPAPRQRTTVQRNASAQSAASNAAALNGSVEFEDDFGGNVFDETDFDHPDEVRLDDTVASNGPQAPKAPNGGQQNAQQSGHQNVQRQTVPRTAPMPQMRPSNVQPPQPVQGVQAPQRLQAVSRPSMNAAQPPNRMLPPQTPSNPQKPQPQQVPHGLSYQNDDGVRSDASSGTTTNSPTFQGPPQQQNGQNGQTTATGPDGPEEQYIQPAPGAPVGFVSGRAADAAKPVGNAAFNPHAESPSIRRTQGINPGVSAPIKRTQLNNVQTPTQHHPPGPGLQGAAGTNGFNGAQRPTAPNFVNPQADMNRRIGMPQQGRPGFQNPNGFKPHTNLKRPAMADVTNTHMGGQTDGASDPKKTKVDDADDGGGDVGTATTEQAAVT